MVAEQGGGGEGYSLVKPSHPMMLCIERGGGLQFGDTIPNDAVIKEIEGGLKFAQTTPNDAVLGRWPISKGGGGLYQANPPPAYANGYPIIQEINLKTKSSLSYHLGLESSYPTLINSSADN